MASTLTTLFYLGLSLSPGIQAQHDSSGQSGVLPSVSLPSRGQCLVKTRRRPPPS
ncbi:Hypothetical predicted protein [Marmota monax]|uniref:Uncharacterized protein n=1 Tax=Marmota monax TaxID=9995 RepID=A0A5E4BKA1_MARMO|nr:hypothetical protein GHT09_007260 [Marmota monax]VTJ69997.1 Hypothetical predicted protein [Marmota monax]